MAKLSKKTNESEVKVEKGTPRVTNCVLMNMKNRPWVVALSNVIYEGTVFMQSVAVRERADGEAYITFPNKKRMKNGKEVLDENGKPVYDAYYGPADAQTRKHIEELVFAAVQAKLDAAPVSKSEPGEEKVMVNLVEKEGLVAFCNVVATGKFFMTGISVNESKDGDVYLQFPSRLRQKNGKEVLDENGKPIYDAYYGPATREDSEKLLGMIGEEVQKKITEAEENQEAA